MSNSKESKTRANSTCLTSQNSAEKYAVITEASSSKAMSLKKRKEEANETFYIARI
jgi:hypothetical protein